MSTTLELQQRTIAMGAGHWIRRWAVIQDGAIREMFLEYTEAQRCLEILREDWESKDE